MTRGLSATPRPVADVEHVRVRQEVHHQVPADSEAHALEEGLEFVGGPVADRRPRIHQAVERPGEPPLPGRMGIDVLDQKRPSRGQAAMEPTEERTRNAIAGIDYTAEEVDKIWGAIKTKGWDSVWKTLKEHGIKMKGQWEVIAGAGQRWGSKHTRTRNHCA